MSSPNVINLDVPTSLDILVKYVELAQQKGAYLLSEADVLKRAIDVLVNKVSDAEIDLTNALNLVVQGVNKGQKSGTYTLTDAALIFRVLQFLQTNVQSGSESKENEEVNDDLATLSEPIPFKTV